MTAFLDTSVLYAAFDRADAHHDRARTVLGALQETVVSDHVLAELWRLVRRRFGQAPAEEIVGEVITSGVALEPVNAADVHAALHIGAEFGDQSFSFVDRTSFAVMRRLGLSRVATFDHHFAVFRFGPGRRRAFEIAH